MRHLLLLLTTLSIPVMSQADALCAATEKSTWKTESAFRTLMKERGYRITKFRVTPGNCYEVYGYDATGHRVELYYDPVSFVLVKSEQVKNN